MYSRIKKITAFALLVCMLATNFLCVLADSSQYTFENASEADGVFTLNGMVLDRNDEIVSDGGQIKTKASDIRNKIILITFESTHKTGSLLLRAASSSRNGKDLIKITNGKVTAFGKNNLAECKENRGYKFAVAVDLSASTPKAALWIDGELKHSGEYNDISSVDLSVAYFELKNNGTDNWTVADFEIKYPNATFLFDLSPGDNEGVSASPDGKITVNTGIVTSTLADKANYELYANEVKLDDFAVETTNAGVEIIPAGGFVEGTTYDLKVLTVTDFFGNNLGEKSIRFYCVRDGYVFPELNFDCDESFIIYQNQEKEINFGCNKAISKLEIYINDELCETLVDEPFTYFFVKDTTGDYTLKAIAYDEYGITSGKEIAVTVVENDSPVIEISGIEDGFEYFFGSFPEVSVSATDTDGISALSFYVDGKLQETVNSGTMAIDLNNLTGGTRSLNFTAEDPYGAKSEKNITVTLSSSSEKLLKSDDFSDYSGSQLPSNSWGMAQRGYIGYKTIKEEFGKSLIVGMEEVNEAYAPNNSAYVGLETQDCQTRVKIELDVYIDKKPSMRRADPQGNTPETADNFVLLFKKNGANEKQIANFQHDKVYILDTPVEYSEKTWYHFVIDLDVAHHRVTAEVSGDDINETFVSDLDAGINVINYLRIIGPVYDEVKTFIAVDNFILKRSMDLPVITVDTGVKAEDKKITFKISEELMPADLTKDNVVLSDEFGGIVTLSAVTPGDGTLTVYPETKLKPATTYILTLSGNCRYSSGEEIGLSVEGSFTTETGEFAITNGSLSGTSFEVKAVNTGNSDVPAYAVMQVWNGNKVKSVKVEPFSINMAETEQSYYLTAPSFAKGEKLTVYIWSGITSPKALTSEIFEFTK